MPVGRPKSSIVRLFLDAGSFAPLVAMAAIAVVTLAPIDSWLDSIPWLFGALWLTSVLGFLFGLSVAMYFRLLVVSEEATPEQRRFWLESLGFLSPVAAPVFWYRVIWKGQSVSVASEKA